MNKRKKILLGFLAFAPFAATIIINSMVARNLASMLGLFFNDASFTDFFVLVLKDYSFIAVFWVINCILSLVQKVVYIVLAIKNKNIKRIIKILYIICILFFEIAVMIYFYLEILHEKKEKPDKEEDSVWID